MTLPLILNDPGELLAFGLTAGHTGERQPLPEISQDLLARLLGDKGYLWPALFEERHERGLQGVTQAKKTLKNRLVKWSDNRLLRQRLQEAKPRLIETVHDPLKNMGQIEQSRDRSGWKVQANLASRGIADSDPPKLPSLDLQPKGLPALPAALF